MRADKPTLACSPHQYFRKNLKVLPLWAHAQGWKQVVSIPRWKRIQGGGFAFYHTQPGLRIDAGGDAEAADVAKEVQSWQCNELRRTTRLVSFLSIPADCVTMLLYIRVESCLANQCLTLSRYKISFPILLEMTVAQWW